MLTNTRKPSLFFLFFFIPLLLSFPSLTVIEKATTQDTDHWYQCGYLEGTVDIIDEFHARGQNFEWIYDGQGSYTWSSSADWVRNTQSDSWERYVYEDHYASDGYYQVQVGMIGAQIYDYYAKFFTPDMSEVRLYDERFEVQRWRTQGQGSWDDVGAQSGTPTFNVWTDQTTVIVTKTFTSWAGTLEIQYIFQEDAGLKHTITWVSYIEEPTEFRVGQKLAGIDGDRLYYRDHQSNSEGEELISGTTILDATEFHFRKSDGSLSFYESQYKTGEWIDDEYVNWILQPSEVDVHAQGMKATFKFRNSTLFTINQGESIVIDPDSATYYSSTEDGGVNKNVDEGPGGTWGQCHDAEDGSSEWGEGASSDTTGFYAESNNDYYSILRWFFYFDTSGLPESTIDSATLKIYGLTNADSDVSAQKGTQADTLTYADYDNFTGSEYGHVSWATGQYNDIAFNAQGKSDIVQDGTTKICAREYSHDYLDSEPSSTSYRNGLYLTEETGTDKDPKLEVTYTPTNTAPTITSASISDMDDTDNTYEMESYYTFVAVVDDGDGATNIEDVYLQICQATTVRVEVRAVDLETTPAFSIQTGATIFDLDTGSCTWGENGDVGTATFKIRFEWDFTDEADLELRVNVGDGAGLIGLETKQTNYFDVIGRLVTSNLAVADGRIDRNTATTVSGNVYYATTVSGDTASAKYPLDAQFTAVHIHNAAHASQGNDASIVNGAFSGISVTVPDAVQSNTYHVYLDLVADYTDADAPDGDTVAIIGDQIVFKTATLETTDAHINSDATGEWYAELMYDYDDAEVTDGSVTLNTDSMTWDSGADNRWEYTNAPASVTDVARNIASVTGNTHGITSLASAVTSDSETIEFDEVVFQTGTFEVTDGRIDYDGTGEWYAKLMLDNNDAAITSGTITLNTGAMSYDGGDSRWEYTNAKGSVGSETRNIASVSGLTGGITKIDSAVTGDSESIVFDRLEILTVAFSDDRVDVSTSSEARYQIQYDYDNVEFDDGKGSITGYVWDGGNSWWDKSITGSASVTSTTYDENDISITDSTYGITSVEDDAGAAIITDRIMVYYETLDDSRVNINANIEYRYKAVLEYDQHALGSGDGITTSWGATSWDAGNSWFDIAHSEASVTGVTVTISSGSEATYTITAIAENITETTGVYDRLEIVSVADDTGDQRIDISSNFELRYQIQYDYDNVEFDDGKGSITDYVWDGGNSWWDKTVTASSSVTSTTYDETDISITDSTYGITAVEDDGGIAIVTDRIKILTLDAIVTRIDVSTEITYIATAELEHDSHALGSGDSFTLSGLAFSWDAGDGRFEATNTEASVTDETLNAFDSGTEATYTITAGNINGQTVTGIWDRIRCDSLGLLDGRINADNSATTTLYGTFSLEYDSHALGSGDSMTIAGVSLSWDGDDSRFEGTTSASASVTSTVFNTFDSGTEVTYSITAVNINSKTVTLIYDKVQVQSYSVNDSRIDIDYYVWVDVTLDYDFDDSDVTDGTVTINGESASHQGSGVWRAIITKSSVQAVTYNTIVASGNTHGITEEDQNGQSQEVIWDRVQVQSYTISDARDNVDDNVNVDVTLDYDYDDSDVTDGTVTINGEATSHQGSGVWRAVITKSSVQAVTYDTVAASSNAQGISTVDQNSQSQQVIWDRVQVQSYTISDARDNVDDNVNVDVTLDYDYDDSDVTDGTVTINGEATSHQGSGVWRAVITKSSVQAVTYDTVAASGNTHGIDNEDQNGQSQQVIWDKVELHSLASNTSLRLKDLNVHVTTKVKFQYDDTIMDSGSLFINNTEATYNATDETWYVDVSQSTVGEYVYIVENFTDSTYDITVNTTTAPTSVTITWTDILIGSTINVSGVSGTFEAAINTTVTWDHNDTIVDSGTFYVYDDSSVVTSAQSNSEGLVQFSLSDFTLHGSGNLTVNGTKSGVNVGNPQLLEYDVSISGLTSSTTVDFTLTESKNVEVSFSNVADLNGTSLKLENLTLGFNVIRDNVVLASSDSATFDLGADSSYSSTESLAIAGMAEGSATLQTVITQLGSEYVLDNVNMTISITGGGGSPSNGGPSTPSEPTIKQMGVSIEQLDFNIYPGSVNIINLPLTVYGTHLASIKKITFDVPWVILNDTLPKQFSDPLALNQTQNFKVMLTPPVNQSLAPVKVSIRVEAESGQSKFGSTGLMNLEVVPYRPPPRPQFSEGMLFLIVAAIGGVVIAASLSKTKTGTKKRTSFDSNLKNMKKSIRSDIRHGRESFNKALRRLKRE